ncbi:FAD:protein FMN transferase [Cohnella sp. JJ-181]|uniref:FAD:protein FMN transferase n=1 Tax=Cohnella rhizoplanae TaxID=2974897 RepID=UPI0022FF5D65|nr:FAD:protein FMN transferase [Cohnella sp. JJ-181]CAI6080606.1 hypothetical protein COHCIP112018_03040 [Cohnella sp. JJ-181]
MAYDSFLAMNTTIVTQGLPERWSKQARSWFAFAEAQLSRFLPDSELSRLNRADGGTFLATPLLYQALEEADRYYRETGGLFSPYLGRVLERLGYDVSFEQMMERAVNGERDRSAAGRKRSRGAGGGADGDVDGGAGDSSGAAVGDPRVHGLNGHPAYADGSPAAEFDPRTRAIRLNPGLSVDLGGIAKGWTARHLAKLARQDGVRTGAVSAGGDLVVWGCPTDGWRIGIADPWRPERDLAALTLRKGAGIATSSAVKRGWTSRDGVARHHIVDPRTGIPAQADLAQATVIAPDAVMAEAYAKCVLVLGSDQGPAWLERANPRCATIGVRYDGSLVYGGELEPYLMEERVLHERMG